MHMRKGSPEELNTIFLMGYDVWHEGQSVEAYIQSCYTSTEYEDGEWYVLENPTTKELLSSLILYDFKTEHEKIYGIGSVATPPNLRKNGYAKELIQAIISLVMNEKNGTYLLLYSDIDPVFYEKLGFVKAPDVMQQEEGKICMIYPNIPPYLLHEQE